MATNYLTTKKDNERCAIVRNMYSEDYFVLPTSHTEYMSFITSFLLGSMFFKRIFNNEETVIFTLIIAFTLIVFSFFAAILTPFIVSIVAAYLLVGLQKKIES